MRLHVKIIMIFCSLVQLIQCANQHQGPILVTFQPTSPKSYSRLRVGRPQLNPAVVVSLLNHTLEQPTNNVDSSDDSSYGTGSDNSSPEPEEDPVFNLEKRQSFTCIPEYRGVPPSDSTHSLLDAWLPGGSPLKRQLSTISDSGTPMHNTTPPTSTKKRELRRKLSHGTTARLDEGTPGHTTTPPTPKR